uniref:Uncharacterized protein n=1 Tax=Anguilla anguilla TaxID=7936 RepID=A0A0E9VKQ7_ANGAN
MYVVCINREGFRGRGDSDVIKMNQCGIKLHPIISVRLSSLSKFSA